MAQLHVKYRGILDREVLTGGKGYEKVVVVLFLQRINHALQMEPRTLHPRSFLYGLDMDVGFRCIRISLARPTIDKAPHAWPATRRPLLSEDAA